MFFGEGRVMKPMLFLLIILVCSCQSIKYEDDLGFLNSAQAGNPEFLVKVNRKPCIDMDKKVGLCAKRIRSNETIVLSHEARPYSYMFELTCTKSIDSNQTINVDVNEPLEITILPQAFNHKTQFTCVGEVFPDDRKLVSSKWHIRFVLVDEKFREREAIYLKKKTGKEHVVFGKYALFSTMGGKTLKKKTAQKYTGGPVYSESRLMRFNYYGF